MTTSRASTLTFTYSYSDDSCMNEFTEGQVARLQNHMSLYRGIDFN